MGQDVKEHLVPLGLSSVTGTSGHLQGGVKMTRNERVKNDYSIPRLSKGLKYLILHTLQIDKIELPFLVKMQYQCSNVLK